MAAKIPWQKIKETALNLAGQLWDEEEKEMRKLVDGLPEGEKQVVTSFSFKIDAGAETPSVKAKIAISKGRITAEKTMSVDDPAQMSLGEKPEAEK